MLLFVLNVLDLALVFAQRKTTGPGPEAGAGAGLGGFCCCFGGYLVIGLGMSAVAFWGVFQKAGIPPWASIVPVYNAMMLAKAAGKPEWWGLLVFVPILGLIIFVLISLEMAKAFGKDQAFAIGLILLWPVFYAILGFGSAQYTAPPPAPPGLGL